MLDWIEAYLEDDLLLCHHFECQHLAAIALPDTQKTIPSMAHIPAGVLDHAMLLERSGDAGLEKLSDIESLETLVRRPLSSPPPQGMVAVSLSQ